MSFNRPEDNPLTPELKAEASAYLSESIKAYLLEHVLAVNDMLPKLGRSIFEAPKDPTERAAYMIVFDARLPGGTIDKRCLASGLTNRVFRFVSHCGAPDTPMSLNLRKALEAHDTAVTYHYVPDTDEEMTPESMAEAAAVTGHGIAQFLGIDLYTHVQERCAAVL